MYLGIQNIRDMNKCSSPTHNINTSCPNFEKKCSIQLFPVLSSHSPRDHLKSVSNNRGSPHCTIPRIVYDLKTCNGTNSPI